MNKEEDVCGQFGKLAKKGKSRFEKASMDLRFKNRVLMLLKHK